MAKTVILEEYAKERSRRIGNLKRYGLIALFLAPFLLAFIVFFLFPLFYGIYISLTNFHYAEPDFQEVFNDFTWYKLLLNKNQESTEFIKINSRTGNIYFTAFWRAMLHSVVFSIIMVPIAIIVPLALAILINKKPPGYKAFRAMVYLPSIVPLTAAGSIFMLIFLNPNQHGLLYELFGVDIKWFSEIWFKWFPDENGNYAIEVAYAWIPIFLMCFWGGWGGNFIILSAGLQNIPKNLYEAADIDGASKWKQTLAVTLSGIKPQLVLCLFTTIIGYLGLYGQNYVLSTGGPSNRTLLSQMPGGGATSTAIYFIQDIVANNLTLRSKLYGLAAAACIIFAVIVGVISGIQMFCTRDRKSGYKISEAYAKWNKVR